MGLGNFFNWVMDLEKIDDRVAFNQIKLHRTAEKKLRNLNPEQIAKILKSK